jgi:hypothetical protein
MRSLIIPLLSLVSLFSVCAQSPADVEGVAELPAKPGRYVGVVTMKKLLFNEQIGSTVSLKAYAHVGEAGALTIVVQVPESPLTVADNPESNVSRGVLQDDGSYLMEGKHRVTVTPLGNSFQLFLSTSTGDGTQNQFVVVPAVIGRDIRDYFKAPSVVTSIHYRFTPLTQPSDRRTLPVGK